MAVDVERIVQQKLNDCDCAYFKGLSASDQVSEKRYREAARTAWSRYQTAGEEKPIPLNDASMCVACLRNKRVESVTELLNTYHRNGKTHS